MKATSPISFGFIAVAAVFGILAAAVALVLFKFGLVGSFIIGFLVALMTAIILVLGWGDLATTLQDITSPASEAPAPRAAPEPAPTPVREPSPEPASAPAAAVTEAPVEEAPVEDVPVKEDLVAEPAEDVVAEAPAVAEKAADGKPEFLSAARAGGPDDLKKIKGIGPKLEKTLHEMGVYHFDQIAGWGPAEQAWIDDNVKGFKGRATRDNWVAQAKTLAAGVTT